MLLLMQGGGGSIPELRERVSVGGFSLYGVMLYSDADKNFIDYLQDAHDALSKMSGEDIFLFWFEHFEEESIILWDPDEDPEARREDIDRNDSLRLARELEIPAKHTPCLLFCRDLEDQEAVTYAIDNSLSHSEMSEHFKRVLDAAAETVDELETDDGHLYRELEAKFQAIEIKQWVKRVVSNESISNLLKAIAIAA